MNRNGPEVSCIVVGAGIAGLLAATRLVAAGMRVTVLDKGRGVGGRMATRRIGNAVFDHGAQFLTTRDPEFKALVAEWREAGHVAEWSRGFPQPFENKVDGHPRFFVRHGMTAVPKSLARDLDVRVSSRVAEISLERRWRVRLDSGEKLSADCLILTAPVPQAMDLLDLGGVELPEPYRGQLLTIRYEPCLTWMVLPTTDRRLPPPGGIQFEQGPLQFIADNQQKGISPEIAGITVNTSPEFARRNFDADEIENWSRIVNEVAEFTGPIRRASFQRWRYAKPVEAHAARAMLVPLEAPLVLCGDAFGGPRIEGAALSGLEAARLIMSHA